MSETRPGVGDSEAAAARPSTPSDTSGASTDLPPHIEDALAAILLLQERHERSSRPVQKWVEGITRRFARPGMVIALLALSLGWMFVNWRLHAVGMQPPDPPPFEGLQVALGITSIILTCMILTTQRRDDILTSHRAHLTLELAILAERKSAKTIELIEELRRDLPSLQNRVDRDALAMATPTDPTVVLEALARDDDEQPPASSG